MVWWQAIHEIIGLVEKFVCFFSTASEKDVKKTQMNSLANPVCPTVYCSAEHLSDLFLFFISENHK